MLPFHEKGFQNSQDEIDVETPLMGLVNNDGVILIEMGILLSFSQQHPVGHNFDVSVAAGSIFETYLISHRFPDLFSELLRNPSGYGGGGNSSGLSTGYPASDSPPCL